MEITLGIITIIYFCVSLIFLIEWIEGYRETYFIIWWPIVAVKYLFYTFFQALQYKI
jgi:hypothetical protein